MVALESEGVELRSVSGEAGQNCGSREVVQHSSSGGQHSLSGGQHFVSGEPENVMASVLPVQGVPLRTSASPSVPHTLPRAGR